MLPDRSGLRRSDRPPQAQRQLDTVRSRSCWLTTAGRAAIGARLEQPRVYRWLFPEPECGAVVAAALSEPAALRWPGGGSGAHHVRARAWLSQTRSTSSTKSVSTAAGVSLAVSRAGVRRRRCCGLVGAGSAALAGWRFRCPPRTSSSLCDCIRLASLCACAASPPRERARITNHASSTYAYPYPVLMSTHRRSGGGSADRAVCSGWCSSVCYLFPSLLEPNAYKAKAKTRRDDSFMRLASAAKAIQISTSERSCEKTAT
jgi:hypothetical protein